MQLFRQSHGRAMKGQIVVLISTSKNLRSKRNIKMSYCLLEDREQPFSKRKLDTRATYFGNAFLFN